MIRPGDYFVSIDMKDAYLMLMMHPDCFRFLCFEWENVRYFYRCMPFGLTSSPRIFTKVFKCVLTFLRKKGLRISAWFDDIILMANSVSLLLEHLKYTMTTIKSLGFIPNMEKSMLVPSQEIYHLGFVWNSVNLTLAVPVNKVSNLKILCSQALAHSVSLRFLNQILGIIKNFRLGYTYAALHYRGIQKDVAFHISNDFNWDDRILLSDSAIADLNWWKECSDSLPPKSISPFVPDLTITTDSSESGWGGISSEGDEAYGFWSPDESRIHINILETKAVIFTFYSLIRKYSNISILIKSDNSTTVTYINNMGGVIALEVNEIIIELFNFCMNKNINIQASHICGRFNTQADNLSRRSRDHCYSLPSNFFKLIRNKMCFSPIIDLFASRLNFKLHNYYSEGPDPFAKEFDAFNNPWPNKVYAFPPINLIEKFIHRFVHLNIEFGLLICPFWPSQPFFPLLLDILIDEPYIFSASILEESSLLPKGASLFLACNISSLSVLTKEFQKKPAHACYEASTPSPYVHTSEPGKTLQIGATQGKLIIAHYL